MLHILTLTWNNANKLLALRNSLYNACNNIDFVWHIKDNASSDNTVSQVESWSDKNIKLHKYKNNLQNFSEGMNYLFNNASPTDNDYVLLLNDDVVFNDSTSLKTMISLMEKDSSIGVVGARLRYLNTDKLQHAGVVFHDRLRTPMHFRLGEKSDFNAEQNREFQVVTGAVMLTKSEYYKNICTTNKSGNKGMCESFVWAFDDVDACLSIKYNLNKKIVYCGKTNIFHEESASLKKNPVNKMFLPQNIKLLKEKWMSRYKLDLQDYLSNPKLNLYNEK